MGAKSCNLNILRSKVPSWLKIPESVCIPFQMMEHAVLVCSGLTVKLGNLMEKLHRTKNLTKLNVRLIRAKQMVLSLNFNYNDKLLKELKDGL